MNELAVFVLLALGVSQLSWIVADSKVMSPLRLAFWGLPIYGQALSALHEWLDDGINCASCVGMWLAFAATLLVMPDFIGGNVWVSVPWYTFALALVARGLYAGIEALKRVATKGEA